jgi:hypothetical protein
MHLLIVASFVGTSFGDEIKGALLVVEAHAALLSVKGGVKVDQCGGAKGSHYGSEKYGGIAGARTSGA